MSQRLMALVMARTVMKRGCKFICWALVETEHVLPDLDEVCHDLRAEIEEALAPISTLGEWLYEQGLYLSKEQEHLARLAWLDRMIANEQEALCSTRSPQ